MPPPAPGRGVRGSAKGDEPDALRTWKANQRAAGIDLRYGDLGGAALQATRQALYLEQTGQCVYCGRAIELGAYTGRHVEHFRPRSRYPDLELAYANLFLSCGPLRSQGHPRPTCGNQKNAWFDETCHVEPAPEDACQGRFVFASDGRICGDGTPEADRMIDVLNLNHSELVYERSALIEELDCELGQGASVAELQRSYRNVGPKGTRVSFANVAVHYLRDQRDHAQYE